MQLEIETCLTALRNKAPYGRVRTAAAKKMLLDDMTVQVNGQVRFLRFQNMGLGVYEVTLADLSGAKKNLVIKGK